MTGSQRDDGGAIRQLREQLLRDGLEGCLPLAHFDSVVSRAAEGLPAQQELLLRLVRSLLDDELMVIGRIGGDVTECVDAWDLSVDDAMARLHDEYVVEYDVYDAYVVHHAEGGWVFGVWFALTARGEQVAQALKEQA